MLSLPASSEGVLPGQLLERAIVAGYVDAGRFKIPEANIQRRAWTCASASGRSASAAVSCPAPTRLSAS